MSSCGREELYVCARKGRCVLCQFRRKCLHFRRSRRPGAPCVITRIPFYRRRSLTRKNIPYDRNQSITIEGNIEVEGQEPLV